MRTLPIAVIIAALATPSLGYPQENGPVGGRIGANGEPTLGSPSPSSSASPYGTPPPATPYGTQPFVGYPAGPGSEAPANLVTTPVPGGLVSGIVGGHSVIIDPTTNVIVRVLN
jgi:hypothetical protein